MTPLFKATYTSYGASYLVHDKEYLVYKVDLSSIMIPSYDGYQTQYIPQIEYYFLIQDDSKNFVTIPASSFKCETKLDKVLK